MMLFIKKTTTIFELLSRPTLLKRARESEEAAVSLFNEHPPL